MAMTAATPAGEPMMDINTTPLIDVMLVLLIMFIITIPLQSHAVRLDLPQTPPKTDFPPPNPVKNKVTINAMGTIFWNGTPVDLLRLRQYLDLTQQMNPIPELHVQPDPQARYVVVDEVLAVTKKAQVAKMGFIGNEAYSGAF
jgi:biopolymer transport protein ExbD